jgi:tetratricopeptide (TPR) repeat protein
MTHGYSEDAENLGGELATIADGLSDVRESIDSIEGSIESLSAAFEEGCWLLCERLDTQNGLLQHIQKQLEQIHAILKSPLATQAKELSLLARACFEKGLFREALARYKQAADLYGEDPLLQFQLGKLSFYAIDRGDSLVNLEDAERHLLLAERYLPLLPEPATPVTRIQSMRNYAYRDNRRFKAQIEHNLAQLYFVRAGERIYERSRNAVETLCFAPADAAFRAGTGELLRKALGHAEAAVNEWKPLLISRYLLARICALLGDRERAIRELIVLGDIDRRYLLRAEKDGVFLGYEIPTLKDIHALGEDGITNLAEEAIRQARWWANAAEFLPHDKGAQERVTTFNQQLRRFEKNIISPAAYPVRLFKPALEIKDGLRKLVNATREGKTITEPWEWPCLLLGRPQSIFDHYLLGYSLFDPDPENRG